jgi:sterol desaturase/sphingolipid hydroxylase (fatty acid hydroxylase superfamily)
MHFGTYALSFLIGSAILSTFAINLFGMAMEHVRPVQKIPVRQRLLGMWFAAFQMAITYAAAPLLFALATLAASLTVGGLIPLPAHGWWLVISVITYVGAMDFLQYWRHRAEHRISWLWALHSFHHDDQTVNAFTTQRVFWLSPIVQYLMVMPIMSALFRAPAIVVSFWVVAETILRATNHLNLRLGFGYLTLWIMGPQYHLIHHSMNPEHRDKNFANMFPVWDWLFGTAYVPASDEFPKTGLIELPAGARFSDAFWWPARLGAPMVRDASDVRRI